MAAARPGVEKKEEPLSSLSEDFNEVLETKEIDDEPFFYYSISDHDESRIYIKPDHVRQETTPLVLCEYKYFSELKLLIQDLDQKKVSKEELCEQFSLQCDSDLHKGVNAAWWLAKHSNYAGYFESDDKEYIRGRSDTNSYESSMNGLALLRQFIKRGVITADQVAQPCQGEQYHGTNALFWLIFNRKRWWSSLYFFFIERFITKEQLSARYTRKSKDDELKDYDGFTVVDLLISKFTDRRSSAGDFLILLDYERNATKVITSEMITDRVRDLINDSRLTAEHASQNDIKSSILALHMILVTSKRSLQLNDTHTRAANIIHEFDQHILNFLMAMLSSPIRNAVVNPATGKASAIGLRSVADDLLEKLLLNNFLKVKGESYNIWRNQSRMLLPPAYVRISKLSFFKSYIKNHLLPLARRNLFEESKQRFIENTTRLVRASIIKLPGGWRLLTKELLDNFKDVMRQGIELYFKNYPNDDISRHTQVNTASQLIATVLQEITTNQPKLNPSLVFKIIKSHEKKKVNCMWEEKAIATPVVMQPSTESAAEKNQSTDSFWKSCR